MKSVKHFRKNSNDGLYSDESKKHKKPNFGQKGNLKNRQRIEELEDDEDDFDFDFKKRETIEDYFEDVDEDDET